MRGYLLKIFLIIITIVCAGCFHIVRYDADYRGRVVDADTGKPIEGAVVLGIWYKGHATVAGAVSEYYDASETLTDKNGEFAINGKGLRLINNLEPMHIFIFKAGYATLDDIPIAIMWSSLKEDIILKEEIKWEEDKAIMSLRKLTEEQRMKYSVARPNIPESKMKLLTNEINKERAAKGINPL